MGKTGTRMMHAALLCGAACAARAQGDKLSVDAGFLFPRTLNAAIGYEHALEFGSTLEFYGEMGDHWREPARTDFWKGYYWDFGLSYKPRMARYKNGRLRLRLGLLFGAVSREFYFGIDLGFEYSHVFRNGWEFTATQKNNFCFRRGDDFRNGLLLGVKVPI